MTLSYNPAEDVQVFKATGVVDQAEQLASKKWGVILSDGHSAGDVIDSIPDRAKYDVGHDEYDIVLIGTEFTARRT